MSQLSLFGATKPEQMTGHPVFDSYVRAAARFGRWWSAPLMGTRMWAHQSCCPLPTLHSPLEFAVMVRAPWDPAEPPRSQKRHRSDRQSSPHVPLRRVLARPRPQLSAVLLSAMEDICAAGDPVLRDFGTTFHSLVMVGWQEWGADVFYDTEVERALWALYRDGKIVMALRPLSSSSSSVPIPFFSITKFHPNAKR